MSLEVKSCAALTEPERAEILALQNEVYSGENLKNTVWLQTESHFDRTVPCFYLGRENDALTAFLSLFLPTQEEAEVTAFTKQSARNCGQFTALLHAAAKEMQVHGVPDFLFDLEPQSETGKAYLKKHFPNAVHSHTEYRMTREPAVFPLPENITVKCVTGETLEDYLSVSLRKYKNFEAAKEMLLAENRTAYVLYVNGEPIGVFDLAGEKTDETLSLCGVAVKASERGRGYGKLLMRAALTEAKNAGKGIELDVDSENPTALNLYRSFGFAPTFEVEYWRVSVHDCL